MRWIIMVVSILFVLFATTVWPTIYRHDILHIGGGGQVIVKTNRFTGTSYVFQPGEGWFMAGK